MHLFSIFISLLPPPPPRVAGGGGGYPSIHLSCYCKQHVCFNRQAGRYIQNTSAARSSQQQTEI